MAKVKLESLKIGYMLVNLEDGRELLFSSDWDWPILASHFGYIPCACGHTDGTVDCRHKTVSEMIGCAAAYLDFMIGDVIEDPGYFE